MKISEIITDKYKLRIPPAVYYELLADVQEAEEEQEPTTKNDLGVDCISREQALVAIRNLYPSMPRVDFNGSLRKWVDKYKPYIECDDAIKELPSVTPQEPNIKALGEELRKVREGIKNEKVLIGFNMAVAICNKHLEESEDKE